MGIVGDRRGLNGVVDGLTCGRSPMKMKPVKVHAADNQIICKHNTISRQTLTLHLEKVIFLITETIKVRYHFLC